MSEYFVIEKEKSEFQKLLNQWRHQYKIKIIWIGYSINTHKYHALIKREGLNE